MKKVGITLMALCLFALGAAHANDSTVPEKKLSTQIQKILNRNTFPLEEGEIMADVRFTINKEGEIVVLSVDTPDATLEGFVKGRLNYQKVELPVIKEGKIFTVSVRVMA
ncbi:MAG: hypothetical protein AAGJ12_10275 [Bacteroidota bacterium]|nr:hypothetical protein [uncultured Allomuricauda sp.]